MSTSFSIFSSPMVSYRILNIVPCTIQQELVFIHLIYKSLHLLTPVLPASSSFTTATLAFVEDMGHHPDLQSRFFKPRPKRVPLGEFLQEACRLLGDTGVRTSGLCCSICPPIAMPASRRPQPWAAPALLPGASPAPRGDLPGLPCPAVPRVTLSSCSAVLCWHEFPPSLPRSWLTSSPALRLSRTPCCWKPLVSPTPSQLVPWDCAPGFPSFCHEIHLGFLLCGQPWARTAPT